MNPSVRAASHVVTRRRGPRIVIAAVAIVLASSMFAALVAADRSADRWTPLAVPIGIFLIAALVRPLEPAPGEKFTLGAAVAFFAASVLPASEAIALVASAAVIAKLVQHSSVLNASVNVAIMLAATAAAAVTGSAPIGAPLGRLVIAGGAYTAITLAGVGVMVVASRDWAAGLAFLRRELLPTLTLVSVGAIAALLWTHDVIAVLLLGIPLAAIERGLRIAARERATVTELSATNEAQRQFTEDAAHELRTPLTALIGELAYVGIGSLDGAELEALASARRTAESLRVMTERLLTFSRAGAVTAGPPADLADVAGEVVARVPARPGVTLRLAAPTALSVAVAPELLSVIVHDIVANAIAYTEAGTIDVEVGELRDLVVLEVRDTGIGIPADELERVFDRFFRGARARALAPGSGLGLAIVRRIVEAHGGSVTVTSGAGAGTTVRVELPVVARPTMPLTSRITS